MFNFFQLQLVMFQPEEVFPKIPATLDFNLLPEFEEQKEEDLNPKPDYGKLNEEYEKEKSFDFEVTVLPLEQTGPVDIHKVQTLTWKDPYYLTENCAYKRIVQVKDKKKKQKAKIYYQTVRLKDCKWPEKKKVEEKTENVDYSYPKVEYVTREEFERRKSNCFQNSF